MPPMKAPGPKGIELLRTIKAFNRDPLGNLVPLWKQYGDIIRIPKLTRSLYIISHPDHVDYILQKKNRKFNKNTLGFSNLRRALGRGLIANDGEDWIKKRKIAQPAFNAELFNSYANIMVHSTQEMLDTWDRLDKSQPIDVYEHFKILTIQITCRAFFSKEISKKRTLTLIQALTQILHCINVACGQIIARPFFLPTRNNQRYKRAIRTFDEFIYPLINERRQSPQTHDDLLAMLMHADLTDKEMRDEIFTMFVGGHETASNVLSWTLYLLSQHPPIVKKLRAEVAEILKGKPPQLSDVKALSYTQMVLKESMRLFPPAWIIERNTIDEEAIDGYVIPKNSLLLIIPYLTHRRDDLWDNPEDFNPERFSPEQEAKRPRSAYYPFVIGPRQCIGKHFAMMELPIILAMILQRYEFNLAPGYQIKPKPEMNLRIGDALEMELKRL